MYFAITGEAGPFGRQGEVLIHFNVNQPNGKDPLPRLEMERPKGTLLNCGNTVPRTLSTPKPSRATRTWKTWRQYECKQLQRPRS